MAAEAYNIMSSSDEPPSCTSTLVEDPTALRRSSSLCREGMKTSLIEGSFSIAHVTLTAPGFLGGYLLLNGATDFQLAVMLAIPYFFMAFQLVAAYLTTYLKNRKLLCCLGVVGWRGVHVILALLPFIPGLTGTQRLWTIFGLLIFCNLSFMMVANTWWMWMADIVPKRVRGRYFGFRSGVNLVLGTFWALAGGQLLDYYKSRGEADYGFCVLFCVATAFAMTGLFFLRRQYEPPMQPESVPSLRQIFSILGNPSFRRASLFMLTWNFGVGLMVFLMPKHMLGYLQMSYLQLMLYPVIVSMIGFLFAKQWGKLIDQVGTRTTLLLCGMTAGFVPIVWIFSAPGTLWPIWFDAVATGLFGTGMTIAATNLPLVITPQKHRLYYLAVFATVTGLGVGIASPLAGQAAMWMKDVRISMPFISHDLVNYHLIFAASAFFRIGSMFLLISLQEENGRSLKHAWARIGAFLAYPFAKRAPVRAQGA